MKPENSGRSEGRQRPVGPASGAGSTHMHNKIYKGQAGGLDCLRNRVTAIYNACLVMGAVEWTGKGQIINLAGAQYSTVQHMAWYGWYCQHPQQFC